MAEPESEVLVLHASRGRSDTACVELGGMGGRSLRRLTRRDGVRYVDIEGSTQSVIREGAINPEFCRGGRACGKVGVYTSELQKLTSRRWRKALRTMNVEEEKRKWRRRGYSGRRDQQREKKPHVGKLAGTVKNSKGKFKGKELTEEVEMEQKLKTNLTADEGRVELGRVQASQSSIGSLRAINKRVCTSKTMNMRRATEKMQGRDADEVDVKRRREEGEIDKAEARKTRKQEYEEKKTYLHRRRSWRRVEGDHRDREHDFPGRAENGEFVKDGNQWEGGEMMRRVGDLRVEKLETRDQFRWFMNLKQRSPINSEASGVATISRNEFNGHLLNHLLGPDSQVERPLVERLPSKSLLTVIVTCAWSSLGILGLVSDPESGVTDRPSGSGNIGKYYA
ncbi:hypothetical protein B0H14DRAFT_2648428 [Mycena olivaceomarginata]|nr:hypothetical protein B0H14DRAFT_2648428 [Mycena olivaceomarginata]